MDVKIIGNAYGAAEYSASYVSKAEPDAVRFRKTIEAALAKLPYGVPYNRLLKRTATAVLAIREVSAQEAVYILCNSLRLYEKSRTVLKVKVSRHDRRYYRVNITEGRPTMPPTSTGHAYRVEPIERASMLRPRTATFAQLPYREFCELYEVSSAVPNTRQHLQRWKLLENGGYIKGRQKKQVIRPSPKYRQNEEDTDYCYAQLFLHKPWRKLSDLPLDDGAVCDEYRAIEARHDVELRATSVGATTPDDEILAFLNLEAKSMTTSSSKCLPLKLNISEGAPVVLTYNMEQRAGLCNGSKGTVYDIIPDDETPAHQPIVLVRMADYRGPSFLFGVSSIIPVTSRTAVLNSKKDGPYRLSRTQGRTCDAVLLDPTSLNSSALAYVALSRVRERTTMFLSSPMSIQQLSKTDKARVLDDLEDERVAVIHKHSVQVAHDLLAPMKTLAHMHNMSCTLLSP